MSRMVRIVQLLCPQRHCIVATAYESPDGAAVPEITERLLAGFQDLVAAGANPWCGICHSHALAPQDDPTVFATMAEAMPHLRLLEARQAFTRSFFRAGKN